MSGAVVLAAGGTGGHLFPAEAVAGELLHRGHIVHLVTDRRADAFAASLPAIARHRVRAGRIGGGPVAAAYGVAELMLGLVQARRLLRRIAPAAVIGFGGYPSLPTMLAAAQLGLPTAIHEQNAVMGRANRLLAPRMGLIATGFAAAAGLRTADSARAVHTGNPVRPEILAIGDSGYAPPDPERPIEVLILGGSQGAHALSEIVPAALIALPGSLRARLRVSQQARPEDLGAVASQYQANGIAAELAPFFEDVPSRLGRAHLVICRAGASTVAELAAAGRPALLVPYPHAADDHQSANARAFAEAGGGWVMPQAALSAAILSDRLRSLLGSPGILAQAAAQAHGFARRDAAEQLATLALAAKPKVEPAARKPAARERAA